MAQYLRPGNHGRHRVIQGAMHENLLVVTAAQATNPRIHNSPIFCGQFGLRNVPELHGRVLAKKAPGLNSDRILVVANLSLLSSRRMAFIVASSGVSPV